ncbi:MAG: HAMP domain-containing protein [Alphaproteobacteria bacterium]|nr:HAMP domain-containing protein [Alphaproteobacteria bacterium]
MKSILYRLSIRARLFGIVIAFLIPISTLTYDLLGLLNGNIEFAEKEMKGNRYERPLLDLFNEIADHRLLSMSKAQDPDAAAELVTVAATIEKALTELEAIDKEVGADLQFTSEGLEPRGRAGMTAQKLSEKWKAFNAASGDRLDLYADMLSHIRAMIAHAGDMSNLILDPDLDSYYTMDVTLLAIPQSLQRLADTAVQYYPILASGRPLTTEERTDILLNARLLRESDLGRITADFETALHEDANAYGESPTLKANIEPAAAIYKKKVETLLAMMESIGNGAQVSGGDFIAVLDDAHDGTATMGEVALGELDVLLARRIDVLEQEKETMLLWCAIAQIIAFGLFFWLTGSVTGPIRTLQRAMADITEGKLDTPVVGQDYRDESGEMARRVETFRTNALKMRALEEEQKRAAIRAEEEKVRARQELAGRFEARVQGIIQTVAAAATELYQTSESMSDVIGNASAKADTVARASGETSQNVQNVASAVEEMSASVREISQQILKSVAAVDSVVTEMGRADQISKLLEEATQRIGQIVELIQTIAGQIDLLALNATIESARAGEAGRGFAVVAGEVKNLANQATGATKDITANIASIQDVSAQVIEVLRSIKTATENVKDISSRIAAAVEEQSAVTNEIAANMARAATGTGEINSGIGEVSQASQSASSSAAQTRDAARMVSEEAEKLNLEVSSFLTEIRNG